jgi:uncharacterized protein YvpB
VPNRRIMLASAPALLATLAGPRRRVAAQAMGAWIDVPAYAQQRNLSCEYAALTIATAAFGAWISEYDFEAQVPLSENLHWGFRGDITGWWGGTDDYGVYPEPLVPALAAFGFSGEVMYAAGNPWAIRTRLDAGLPVLLWLALQGGSGFYRTANDGSPFLLVPGYHVVVANGYDEGGVHVADPATGGFDFYDWGTLLWMWEIMNGMALAVSQV